MLPSLLLPVAGELGWIKGHARLIKRLGSELCSVRDVRLFNVLLFQDRVDHHFVVQSYWFFDWKGLRVWCLSIWHRLISFSSWFIETIFCMLSEYDDVEGLSFALRSIGCLLWLLRRCAS